MGNGTSRVVGCFVPFNAKSTVDLEFLEQLDEGLGHSFCYVRPNHLESPAITPSNSERFTVDSSILDSETLSGSFRHEAIEDPPSLLRTCKNAPEKTFNTISGASVSANVSTARTGNERVLLDSEMQEPAASFESTPSFAAIPLHPIPRGSGPLNGFMSGPLERGFASGPLERGAGCMSGPIEGGVMSGPLDAIDKSNFSAPLSRRRRRPPFQRLMRSVSGPIRSSLSRTFSQPSTSFGWMRRLFSHPAAQSEWHINREARLQAVTPKHSLEGVNLEEEYENGRNLQWAHGKAGEDRIQVVLSEEQGWLFVGIYDGFSGPDAPDFLMRHLYKAIDKTLEGLLWDYGDENLARDSPKLEFTETAEPSHCSQRILQGHSDSKPNEVSSGTTVSCDGFEFGGESSSSGIVRETDGHTDSVEINFSASRRTNALETSVSSVRIPHQGQRRMRLYELIQIEQRDEESWTPSFGCHKLSDNFVGSSEVPEREALNMEASSVTGKAETGPNLIDIGVPDGSSASEQRLASAKSLISAKIRNMNRKKKLLQKKLFPWYYDWHREDTCVEDRTVEASGPIRRCRTGTIDHDVVLRAMAQALQNTEAAYMQLVEKNLNINPELALMGSCVLVMLMKGQDVYVMNVGDSRVIVAQERLNDQHQHLDPRISKDDTIYGNRFRESVVRTELDCISEESPIHNKITQVNTVTRNRDTPAYQLKMRAVQLSSDHSTSISEEVSRVRLEHADDEEAILKDRLKGQLKVTRAFGAGFLKKPSFNNALLEMFRIDYVGTAPYLSCIPWVCHYSLSPSDRFMVLSSDGLYEYFSNEELVAHVAWFVDNVPEGDPAQYLIAELLIRAAKKNGMDFHDLLDIPQGDRRKYHDDVSVMVISLEGRIWRSSG